MELYTTLQPNEKQLNEDIRDAGFYICQAIYDYRNKRRLIIGGIIGVGLLSIAGSFFGLKYILNQEESKDKEITFEKAKAKVSPSLRQKFIDDVIEAYPPPIKNLSAIYDNNKDYGDSIIPGTGTIMETKAFFPPHESTKKIELYIYIGVLFSMPTLKTSF